jgi:hypothetical protein
MAAQKHCRKCGPETFPATSASALHAQSICRFSKPTAFAQPRQSKRFEKKILPEEELRNLG